MIKKPLNTRIVLMASIYLTGWPSLQAYELALGKTQTTIGACIHYIDRSQVCERLSEAHCSIKRHARWEGAGTICLATDPLPT